MRWLINLLLGLLRLFLSGHRPSQQDASTEPKLKRRFRDLLRRRRR